MQRTNKNKRRGVAISRNYFLIFLAFLTFRCSAQDVYSKDGVYMGKRSDFIESCAKGYKSAHIDMNGITVDVNSYCSCVCDNVMPHITSNDLLEAVKSNKMKEFLMNGENYELVRSCIEGNYSISDDYKLDKNSSITRETSLNGCVREFLKGVGDSSGWTVAEAEEYCKCAIDKLYSEGYTYGDLNKIEDENSRVFNEVAVPCVATVLKNRSTSKNKSASAAAISGSYSNSQVKLLSYFGKGYKLKLTIGGLERYFILDTGASMTIIDRDLERELLLEGVIKRGDYLDKRDFTMANGDVVEAQVVVVHDVKIGEYTVSNLQVAIVDNGSLLLGKSLLDLFSKWEVVKSSESLVLYK